MPLANLESQLRLGQIADALRAVQEGIRTQSHFVDSKRSKKKTKGVKKARTMYEKNRQAAARRVEVYRQIYERARAALIELGHGDDLSAYLTLTKEDTAVGGLAAAGTGRSTKKMSWIWKLHRDSNMSKAQLEEWNKEGILPLPGIALGLSNPSLLPLVDRTNWFQCRARRDRWREEQEKLDAEVTRCRRAFGWYRDTWNSLATAFPVTDAEFGRNAYARKKAAMFEQLSANLPSQPLS